MHAGFGVGVAVWYQSRATIKKNNNVMLHEELVYTNFMSCGDGYPPLQRSLHM